MTSPRKPGFVLPFAVTLAVLLGLYVGAYYAMVRVGRMETYHHSDGVRSSAEITIYPKFVDYVLDEEWLRPLFTPMHWLDRRIRPHVWEPSLTQEDIDIVRDPAQR